MRLGDCGKTNLHTYSDKEKWSLIRYLDTGSITEGRIDEIQTLYPGVDKIPSRARRKASVGDILFSTVRPNQKHYGIIEAGTENLLVSTGFTVVTVDTTIADPYFIYYYLTQSSVIESLQAIAEQSTSTYPSIKPSDIEDIELDLPELETQKKIGSTLRMLDRKIALNEEINDYLHFLLGNGIIADVFSEYRSAVKNLMSLLVYKYSTQGKKVLHEQPFPFIDGNDVYFDEIDFHCFIEYFDAKEIIALLSKYHIETIEFQNMASIENAVNNLLDYYSYTVKSSKNNIDVIGLQTQIKNCLALLRYVSISQGLVDKICGFILTQEFREILINDKVLFLDRQLVHRKMYSKTTSKIVENTLISYLDKHIAALKKGERFELFSASTGINYCNLVHYISAPEEKYYSRRLSMRISQIINNNLSQMYYQITQHYCGYVSRNQQKKLITWANKLIQMNFSFDLFKMLVQCDARISKAAKTQLKVYLKQRIDAAKNKNNNGVVVYPTKQPYEELDQVGYWCLFNVLKAKDFQEFLGNSEAFDFYCEYAKFDFSRFDVSWLLNLYPHTLEQIAKNAKVKERVRVAIATTLDGEAIAPSDSQRLQSILVKHFC